MAKQLSKNTELQITELRNEGLDFHVSVKIPSADIDSKIQSEIIKLAKNVKLKGFRQGKVPQKTVEKMYGTSVRQDVLQQEINHVINDITKKNNLDLATDPRIEDFKAEIGQDVEFTLKFERIPEIDMPDFAKITIEKPILQVNDEEVDAAILKLAEMSKTYTKESKGKASKGDQVTLDAIGYSEGAEFAGGKLEAYKLVLGSKSFVDNFEDQLIGTKKNDEVTVNVTFPENYGAANLAGKPAEFKVKILAVHKADDFEINDELAKKFKVDSLEELRKQVMQSLQYESAEPVHTIMKMNLFNQLEQTLKFAVPNSLIEREYQILKSQTDEIKKSDVDLKDKSEQELDNYYNKLSNRRVRIGLMLAEYVKKNNILIEQDDIKNAVMAQARNYPGQEIAIVEYYQKNQKALEGLKGPILEEKSVRHIFEQQVKIKEKTLAKKEFDKYLEKESNKQVI